MLDFFFGAGGEFIVRCPLCDGECTKVFYLDDEELVERIQERRGKGQLIGKLPTYRWDAENKANEEAESLRRALQELRERGDVIIAKRGDYVICPVCGLERKKDDVEKPLEKMGVRVRYVSD